MSDDFEEDIEFAAARDEAEDGTGLILDIDGYEGPLHLLLELARQQKVDMARISVLQLAEQYLAFIKSAKDLRIELAADYLVMAAWLTYLKSRLILPREGVDEQLPEADELAAHLAFRLQRLEIMRRAADGLFRLNQSGVQTHMRGAPEGLRSKTTPLWEAGLFDIIQAYGAIRSKNAFRNAKIVKPAVLSLDDARTRLRRALLSIGWTDDDWTQLEALLPVSDSLQSDIPSTSVRASSLAAGLELAKLGEIEMRQSGTFAPIFVRGAGDKNGRAGSDSQNNEEKA